MLRRAVFLLLAAIPPTTGAGPERSPVLIELFTSEGCSSCPPADRLLQSLDPSAIILSEHVDYWDRLGWRDPFSSHASTLRQERYARRFAVEGPYTPQMVIDGAVEFVGNDSRRAASELANAERHPRVPVELRQSSAGLEIETGPALASADVWLGVAQDHAATQVTAGENRGRNLTHAAVLLSLRKVGSVKRGAAFHQTVALPGGTSGKRLIVFLQDSDLGRVSGAGLLVP